MFPALSSIENVYLYFPKERLLVGYVAPVLHTVPADKLEMVTSFHTDHRESHFSRSIESAVVSISVLPV